MLKQLKKLVKKENGQAVTEYGIVVGLVVVMAIAVFVIFRPAIVAVFTDIAAGIQAAI
jgi:pilus assembly protein Flp/PilA